MMIFPRAILDGLTVFLSCEPIIYILSIMGLAVIALILRELMS